MARTRVLGISAYYHDSAACLLVDGEIVAAAQEERFSRRKHDPSFPARAIKNCLDCAGIDIGQVDFVGFYEKPLVKFERLLTTYVSVAPRGLRSFLTAMPVWLGQKLWIKDEIMRRLSFSGPVLFGDHHESHAASAFYPSPYERAAILTVDGVGEWATASVGFGSGSELTLLKQLHFPHSLGLIYSAFTHFCGFKVNSGEYKLMGLAPYGEPTYVHTIRERLVEVHADGSLKLNLEYFDYCYGLRMTNTAFERLFGGPPRSPEGEITQREMDLARSIQEVTEEVMLNMARFAHRETGATNLCLAGGVALNCVANRRVLRDGPFQDVWAQPAAGDAGGSLGVALAIWHRYLGRARKSAEETGRWHPPNAGRSDPLGIALPYADEMKGALLGPSFSQEDIETWLRDQGYAAHRLSRVDLPQNVAERLAQGQVIGLFQGRMEFGPRALGARSIIADPRSPAMQAVLNLKIKFRESFRPFAPAILRERVSDWFQLDRDSPYMLLVADVSNTRRIPPNESTAVSDTARINAVRSQIPAVTHVDFSARVQTVRRETHPLFYDIIEAFDRLTGCPVVVNTSFNVRGEPIVCSPADAYRCFMRTDMDALLIGTFLFEKR